MGVEKATRLLGYLALSDKVYEATIRLGIGTITDDAEGDVATTMGVADLGEAEIEAAMAKLRGDILQVPAAVSAIKINGVGPTGGCVLVSRWSCPNGRSPSADLSCSVAENSRSMGSVVLTSSW